MTDEIEKEDALNATEHETGKKMIIDALDRINDPTITYFLGMIADRIADLAEDRLNKSFGQNVHARQGQH